MKPEKSSYRVLNNLDFKVCVCVYPKPKMFVNVFKLTFEYKLCVHINHKIHNLDSRAKSMSSIKSIELSDGRRENK